MSCAQVVENYLPGSEIKRKTKPSALGHFLSRMSSMKHRSRSPQDSPKSPKDAIAPFLTESSCSNETRIKAVIGITSAAENDSHSTPPPKPKRQSSPFVRIIHRLSMNRKTRGIPTAAAAAVITTSPKSRTFDCSDVDRYRLNSSRETVYSTSSPSTAYTIEKDILSRPAVSENDLRFVTLHKNQEMERSATSFCMNTNGIHSDSLNATKRVPSYLRISCALNGYRRPYRRLEAFQSQSPSTQKLPMSIVEARTLTFTQNTNPSNPTSVKLEKETVQNNSHMDDCASGTPVPVRQLVAQFDRMQEVAGKMDGSLSEEQENMGGRNTNAIDETDIATPLNQPVAPGNSIAVSDQLYGAAYSHTSPKPSVAQRMHYAQLKTIMESKPNVNNQAEIRIENLESTIEHVAEKVKNDNNINYALPSGESYRDLLMEARASLQAHCAEAENDLKDENSLPDFAAGALRVANGKAKLLIGKKMAKFEELVSRHLNQKVDDTQTVKLSDLSGYWALISIELEELEARFREISLLRENNWDEEKVKTVSTSVTGEYHAYSTEKMGQPSSGMVNDEVAFESYRQKLALAAVKHHHTELMKEKELQQPE